MSGADLPALAKVFGQEYFFEERFARQHRGKGILLAAWMEGEALPVSDIYVWLSPAEEPELQRILDGVPLLTHLEVREDLRNRGIGTKMMNESERLLTVRGHRQVVLGVDPGNSGALRLYRRLGYADWGHGPLVTEKVTFLDGHREIREQEECLILTKALPYPDEPGAGPR